MSGKRIVIVEPCVHGWEKEHWLNVDGSPIGGWQQGLNKTPCDGATRRVLTEGQYVLIEKTDGRWPTWAMEAMGEAEAEAIRTASWSVYFDALSDHTEGTP